MASVGSRVAPANNREFLTGGGQFLDDVDVPGVLHVAFVRSPHAHAAIRGIDTSAARQVAGVTAVLTLNDVAKTATAPRLPLVGATAPARVPSTPYILACDEVAYVGEIVALVAADSRYAAEDAAGLVVVDYEPLPVVTDVRAAVRPGAPTVRTELADNILSTQKVAYGDIDAAFRPGPETLVFAEEITLHRGCGHPLEGRGVVAEVRPREGTLTVWSSTQMPNVLWQTIVEVTGIDDNKLRVLTPDVGGGFGPKYCIYPEEIAVACAARLLGRSLKWVEDRRENFLAAVQERDQVWTVEVAVSPDGRLKGVRGHLLHDQGAYALKPANLPYNSATALPGPYLLPAYAMDITVALTSKVPVSSVRGAGYPQAVFVMERLVDRVARELGLDRAEVRRRNLIPAAKMPYEKPLKARSGAGIVYDSGDYPAAQAHVLAAAGWDDFGSRQSQARAEGRYIGIGLANAVKGTGRGPFETGIVRVASSGRVSVFTGAAEMGQGLRTALAQICADELGVTPDEVSVIAGDTAVSPLGLGGFASRQLVTAGSSVRLSARAVAAKAKKLAAHKLEAAEADLVLAEGRIHVAGAPGHGVSLGALARVLRGAPGYAFPDGLDPGLEANTPFQSDALAYANVHHVAEVEVDVETGAVVVTRYVALQDSGVLINPMLVEGQVRGAITHGIGNALFEHMHWDANCQPLTTTFADYLLPTSTVLPCYETMFLQTPSPLNPLGAKGVGEVGTIPAAAAVISAIDDALRPFGVSIREAPITPPRLLALIAGQGRHTAPPLRGQVRRPSA